VGLPTWRWIANIYHEFVHLFSGIRSWDSCGPEVGELCRHNMPMPEWMQPS
jgi:hypothetical protein